MKISVLGTFLIMACVSMSPICYAQNINLNAAASTFNVYQLGVSKAVVDGVRQATNFYDKNVQYQSNDIVPDDLGPGVDSDLNRMEWLDNLTRSDLEQALLALTRVYVRTRQAHPNLTQAQMSALIGNQTNQAYARFIDRIKFSGGLW